MENKTMKMAIEFKEKNIEMSKGFWRYIWEHQKWVFLTIIIPPIFVGIIIGQYFGNKFYMKHGLNKQIASEERLRSS